MNDAFGFLGVGAAGRRAAQCAYVFEGRNET